MYTSQILQNLRNVIVTHCDFLKESMWQNDWHPRRTKAEVFSILSVCLHDTFALLCWRVCIPRTAKGACAQDCGSLEDPDQILY